MNLTERKFKITGVFPLMTHNPASMMSGPQGPKTKRIPTPEEEAQAGLYVTEDGDYFLPSVAFRSALLSGLKGKRIGKIGAATVIKPAVFNADEQTVILDPQTGEPNREWVVDARRAIIQRNGVVRCRPRFNRWGAVLRLLIDEEIASAELLEEHLNIAGTTVGVGDYRIERGGQFGSFTAELIEE